ncbi:MAG: phosphoribosylamine--glycine ligase [Acidobacterium sp.]|nr:phosphoribosylamine--glycine ligase [Acidobacteriota bacterium]PHY10161.1 MAG: phosphoribosylamine--glycine ligase [Acidobacterium sp.]
MRILIIGSGGREHALAQTLGREPGVDYLLCAPGNPGMSVASVTTEPLDILDTDAVVRLIARERIDLTVVGPEAPLGLGLADRLAAEGRLVFGPTRAAAQLETSKAFAKHFMQRHHVPTAHYRVCTTAAAALAAIRSGEFGDALVVKADGLAGGKGVVVAPDRATAEAAVNAAMIDRSFGDAGACVVLEEMLTGPEVSFFVVADGEHYVPLLSAQDHKRIFDHDEGPNTGGMGAFSPSPLMTVALQARVEREIVKPVLDGMAAEGTPFRGFLYCGLMLTADGPKVIEFNVRFGDPEAQVVLPLLAAPLAPLLTAAAEGRLSGSRIPDPGARRVSVGVVLAAHGYPGEVRSGDVITGLDEVKRDCPDVMVFHAGVKQRGADLVTAGGRVLTVVATAPSFATAIARAYEAASKIHFNGVQFRRDIGQKALGR